MKSNLGHSVILSE